MGGGPTQSAVIAVTHAGASHGTQHTVLSHAYAIEEACWRNKQPLEQGEQSHEDGAQSAGDTAASAGGLAQEIFPREGLACSHLYFQRPQRLGEPGAMSKVMEKPL